MHAPNFSIEPSGDSRVYTKSMGPSSVVRGRGRSLEMATSAVVTQERDASPAALEVREHLEKVLASRFFIRSNRLKRFLRFCIDHALAGSGDQVKEYRIGVEVFDRRADYDPRIDPIVRVEARRLRSKLKAYYTTAGRGDAVTVELPKGAYTPSFRSRAATRQVHRV